MTFYNTQVGFRGKSIGERWIGISMLTRIVKADHCGYLSKRFTHLKKCFCWVIDA